MNYKLLVFDWDGTLMDSEEVIIYCMQSAFADLGLRKPSDDAVRNVIGLGLKEAVEMLYTDIDESLSQGLMERYRRYFFSDEISAGALFPRVEETLSALDEAGYLLAVATGKGRLGLDKALDESGLSRYFIATRCADESLSKPHPEMLNQLIDYAGVDAAEVVMIGDTEYDLQMAANAGTAAVAVGYGVHEVERLMQFNPLACLSAIDQLPGCLAGVAKEG